jgi:hypothetical protein
MVAVINREWLGSIWKAVGTGQAIDWADFEWYALDRDGSIGMLTSAGPGPVPRYIFRDLDAYISALEFFGRLLRRGGAEILIEMPRVDDWRLAAERGIYGFDYLDGPGSKPAGYYMVARPEESLHVEAVPGWLREWLEPATLNQAVFAQSMGAALDLSGTGLESL